MIRAKFRCLGVEERWDGTTNVDLQPVIPSKKDDGQGENARFWEATPAGSIKLTLTRGAIHTFVSGAYYYIDFARSAEGRWDLYSFTKSMNSMEVVFSARWDNTADIGDGTIKLTVDNDDLLGEFDTWVGFPWSVVFTPTAE